MTDREAVAEIYENLIRKAVAAERERCAELAKNLLEKLVGPVEAGFVAMKIREAL